MTTAALLALGRPTFDVEFGAKLASAAHRVLEDIGVTTIGDDTVLTASAMSAATVRTSPRRPSWPEPRRPMC